MSGFSSAALPGRMPTAGSGKDSVNPESLFSSRRERSAYEQILEQNTAGQNLNIKKVKVEVFDMSDPKQVRRYEKLWKELLEKVSRMEAVVDYSKNLVQRPDGTSYWMKYVEYVEFGKSTGGSRNER